MPDTKNAIVRYHILDELLGSPKKRNAQKLLQALNERLENDGFSTIGRTQFYKDIDFMESENGYRAEIEKIKDGTSTIYRYADSSYSIRKSDMSPAQIEAIKDVIALMENMQGIPQMGGLLDVLPKLKDLIGTADQEQKIILFEENIDYQGLQYIDTLFNYIKHNDVLTISYQDFKSDHPYDITFHPYLLKEYNNRWFVFGLNEKEGNTENAIWNLALDRIKGMDVLEDKTHIPSKITDWEYYFSDIIGVTKHNKPVEHIQMKIHKTIEPYIRTKPVHQTQRQIKPIEGEPDWFLLEFFVIPNFELERWINGYGTKIKLLTEIDFGRPRTE